MECLDQNLILYLEKKLKKTFSLIEESDLKTIKHLELDSKTLDGKKNIFDCNFITKFPNLNSITIKNTVITSRQLKFLCLRKIKTLKMINSTFSSNINYQPLENIKTMYLDNCYVENYNEFFKYAKNLHKIEIINQADQNYFDIKCITDIYGLNELILEKCFLMNVDSLSSLKELKKISLTGSYIESNFTFLFNMPNVSYLYLSPIYEQNKNIMELKKQIIIKFVPTKA